MEKENRLSKKKELPKNTGLRAVRIALPMTYTPTIALQEVAAIELYN
jgi:hypothetical protein